VSGRIGVLTNAYFFEVGQLALFYNVKNNKMFHIQWCIWVASHHALFWMRYYTYILLTSINVQSASLFSARNDCLLITAYWRRSVRCTDLSFWGYQPLTREVFIEGINKMAYEFWQNERLGQSQLSPNEFWYSFACRGAHECNKYNHLIYLCNIN
jgi:hypothetical protein